MTGVDEVVESIKELIQDEDVPKGVSSKLNSIADDLQSEKELSLTVNKAVGELEDMSTDVNIPPFVRTQLWGIISLLGALEAKIVRH